MRLHQEDYCLKLALDRSKSGLVKVGRSRHWAEKRISAIEMEAGL